MYKSGRCGFFHSGMAKKGIILKDHDSDITFEGDNIFIDRYKIVESIKKHFNNYINKLKTGDQLLIEKFNKAWSIVHS